VVVILVQFKTSSGVSVASIYFRLVPIRLRDFMQFGLHRMTSLRSVCCIPTTTNVLWIKNCSVYGEPMTLKVLDRLAGSQWMLHAVGSSGQTSY